MRIIEPVQLKPELMDVGSFLLEPDAEPLFVQVAQPYQVASMTTNVPEDDQPLWESTEPYTVGDLVMLNHHIYQAYMDNTNVNPSTAVTSPATWQDLGFTNRWRMFDDKVGTVTSNPESITLKIAPGKAVDAMAFFGVDAASVFVRVVDPYQGIIFESQVSPVSTDGVDDWYSYFFSPVELKEDFVILNIPAGSYGSIDVVISKPGGIAALGALILGKMAVLGETLYGTSTGITDYSLKDVDDFGNFTVVERGYSKRAEFDISVDTGKVDTVQRKLSKYRAKPIVWIGDPRYPSTIVYGYYGDFNLVLGGPEISGCSISVKGLV